MDQRSTRITKESSALLNLFAIGFPKNIALGEAVPLIKWS